ncbi:MAG TPA: adenylate/guanylate cyclase domain-containing protein [Aliidongia sp.]|uniref:adenylate/guanylate cyclase domain-containing protein n=1 Tax=Aliidongia sp. TaxID=1914230 RepID=UPI002DDC9F4E|nr:adenylate/guanylate cyclase domain-containing protein [Aliidongia sp.]HEV2676901.1 adenylate/guanylate cyclase domain-containing protein [Aliidongia sp.]
MRQERLKPFVIWLAELHGSGADIDALHQSLCRELVKLGYGIWRSGLLLETLDPEFSGGRTIWSRDGEEELQVTLNPHSKDLSETYARSPLKIIDETGRTLRARLDAPILALPLFEELRAEGATDYMIVPLAFAERRRSAGLSFTTDAPGGFTDEDVNELEIISKLISATFEVRLLRHIAINLLETYVGPQAGASILDGSVKRGDGGRMRAVIWYSDLRNFTRLTETMETSELLDLLNEYFDIFGTAATKRGGEVVQHIGDAIMIYFTVRDDSTDGMVTAGVIEAAEEALAGLDAANEARRARGAVEIKCGIGLDIGEVTHGNVGSVRRLSFNVVGPAVNRASRIETLTKALGTPLLMSADFARTTGRPWLSAGWHALKGVPDPVEIARLPDPARAAKERVDEDRRPEPLRADPLRS